MSKKLLVVDIETCNITEDALCYDLGFAVADRQGNIYEEYSFIVYETFFGMSDLMKSAYYAHKIPLYLADYEAKKIRCVSILTAKRIVAEVMAKYDINEVFAYNMDFDHKGLDRTIHYLTKSKVKYFFPYGTKFYCIWNMACQVLFTQKTFYKTALVNNWLSEKGNFQTSAEIAYRYITRNTEFEEEHRGLDDVRIETLILAKCFAQHKKMDKKVNKGCWRIPTKKYKESIK